ncbi:MAG: hypothetical protein IJV91_03900, partial [Kiritimatiellae bacterium]|nr:hypothetical protein [Kiritimatiellia bacterium]
MPLSTERTQFDELSAIVNSGNVPSYVTFHKVLPMVSVLDRAGTVAVMPCDGAAVGVENKEGSARTAEMLTSKSVTYTLANRSAKRTGVLFDEEAQLGNDVDNVIALGGGRCARDFFRGVDTAAWALWGPTMKTAALKTGT